MEEDFGAGRTLSQADQAGRRLRPGGTGNGLNPVQDRAVWKLERPPEGRWAEAEYCIRLSSQPRSWGWFLLPQHLRGRGS